MRARYIVCKAILDWRVIDSHVDYGAVANVYSTGEKFFRRRDAKRRARALNGGAS